VSAGRPIGKCSAISSILLKNPKSFTARLLFTNKHYDWFLVPQDGQTMQTGAYDALAPQPGLFERMLQSVLKNSGFELARCF